MVVLIKDYAKMCEAVYHIPGTPFPIIEHIGLHLPQNWHLVDSFEPESGFGTFFAVFANEDVKEVVLAIRGTDNFYNGIDNAMLAFGRITDNRNELRGQRHIEEAAQQVCTGLIFGDCKDATDELSAITEDVTNWSVKLFLKALTLIMGEKSAPLAALISNYFGTNLNGQVVASSHPKRLNQLSKTIADKYPGYGLKIVGHSLGGCMAILCATAINCSAITFESCGAINLMEGLDRYRELARQIRDTEFERVGTYNFVSAPNIINMFDRHPGRIFRMKIPHNSMPIDTNNNSFLTIYNMTTDYFLNNSCLRYQHNITHICEYLSNPQNYIYEMADWPDYTARGGFWSLVEKPFQSAANFLGSFIWEQEDQGVKKEREVTQHEKYVELPNGRYSVAVENLIVNISVEEMVRRINKDKSLKKEL